MKRVSSLNLISKSLSGIDFRIQTCHIYFEDNNNNQLKDEAKFTIYPITNKVQRELDALEKKPATSNAFEDMKNHLWTTPSFPMKDIVFKMKYIKAFEYRRIVVE